MKNFNDNFFMLIVFDAVAFEPLNLRLKIAADLIELSCHISHVIDIADYQINGSSLRTDLTHSAYASSLLHLLVSLSSALDNYSPCSFRQNIVRLPCKNRRQKMENKTATILCPECSGKGYVTCPVCHGQGRRPSPVAFQRPCPNCHGTGKSVCPNCRGAKKVAG
jgi:DnaJ central domain